MSDAAPTLDPQPPTTTEMSREGDDAQGAQGGKRRALGRGLSALLPGTPARTAAAGPAGAAPAAAEAPAAEPRGPRTYFRAPIEEIRPGPEQPRKRFGEEELEELASSIRAHGVIQPLIVRARKEGGFWLIAGERRWRAAQRAGLHEVPVVVQDVSPREAFERALVENLQRSDLNPIEEAEAYQRLVDEHGYTQEQIAERVGKDRSTVANSLRLLKLPPPVRKKVEEGALSMGHARALLGLESAADIEVAARQVVGRGLSVRATEAMVRQRLGGASAPAARAPEQKSASVRDVERRLTKALGAQVSLTEDRSGKGGRIEIRYADLDDLDRLLERFLRR
ncbi:MAG TPA: ParB/RepB/Spo0J family partition protein [Kofleriaceae bacterium]|nr:ParB/RepB/Spo0J family partition protein [Kofleriaceae bacterium]